MLLLILVIFLVLALFGLAAFVVLQTKKSPLSDSFGVFAASMGVWMFANFIGANYKSSQAADYFIYIDFLFGPIMVYFFWRFTHQLYTLASRRVKTQVGWSKIILAAAVFGSLLPLTQEVAVIAHRNGEVVIDYGPLYAVYSFVLIGITLASVANMVLARKKAHNLLRTQINTMLWGIGFAVFMVSFANLIVPQLTEARAINLLAGNLSYVGIVLFVGITAYAIVRHKLFDLRLIVARSIAYAALLAVLVGVYASIAFGISSVLPSSVELPLIQQLSYVVITIILALTFQPLKKNFDRITNRLFYRDAYDAQEFLDQLNQILVSTIELRALMHSCSEVIERNIKAEFCAFSLRHSTFGPARVLGSGKHKFTEENITEELDGLVDLPEKVIITDYLDGEQRNLVRTLNKRNIAALVRLSSGASDGRVGYILLGPKKSGNPFNSQDMKVLEIIANELVIAIQNALRFEEIQNFNIKLQEEVRSATAQLQRTNAKLVALDETKDDFISMASHQLRTPLTSVKGYLSMVLEGDTGKVDPKQRKLLNQAFISSERMVYLIADLLNVSRLRTGKFVIEPSEVNLAETIEEEVGQLQETAAARGLKMTYEKPKDFPVLMLDETKIRQVIMNFMDNAIYYTPTGGKIQVSLSESERSIEFTVTDNGIGVPKHEQHHLFSKFYRAGNARKARPDGTGLGLFMAKKVVIAQGGSIIFKSQENKGSTFGFTFAKAHLRPGNQPQPAATPAEPEPVPAITE